MHRVIYKDRDANTDSWQAQTEKSKTEKKSEAYRWLKSQINNLKYQHGTARTHFSRALFYFNLTAFRVLMF